MARFPSLLWLSNIPLGMCIPHHLYPLVDQWTPRLPSVSQLSALPQLYPNFGLICINLFSFLNLPKLFFSIFICCMALMFYSEKYPVCVCVCGERGRHVCLSVGVYLCECIFLWDSSEDYPFQVPPRAHTVGVTLLSAVTVLGSSYWGSSERTTKKSKLIKSLCVCVCYNLGDLCVWLCVRVWVGMCEWRCVCVCVCECV